MSRHALLFHNLLLIGIDLSTDCASALQLVLQKVTVLQLNLLLTISETLLH